MNLSLNWIRSTRWATFREKCYMDHFIKFGKFAQQYLFFRKITLFIKPAGSRKLSPNDTILYTDIIIRMIILHGYICPHEIFTRIYLSAWNFATLLRSGRLTQHTAVEHTPYYWLFCPSLKGSQQNGEESDIISCWQELFTL